MHTKSETMERLLTLSLRYKLAGLFAALFTLISVSLYAYLPARFHAQAIKVMIQNAVGVADGLAYNLAPAVYFEDSEGIGTVLKGAMLNKNLIDIVVQDPTGLVLGELTGVDSVAHVRTFQRGVEGISVEENVLRIARSIRHDDASLGTVSTYFDLTLLNHEMAASRSAIAMISLFVFALGMLLTYVVGQLVTKRLWRIVQVSDAISHGDLTRRVQEYPRDEIGKLGSTFNNMVTSIQFANQELKSRAVQLDRELEVRQRAEAETNRIKEFLKDVINSTPAPLLAVDPEGRITLWNQMLERETGLSDAGLQQALAWEVIPILADHSDLINEAIKLGTLQKRERLLYTQSEPQRYVNVLVYPLHGKYTGAVVRLDEVTEEVRMLELMAQTEKMMSVGGLAAGMAHEINNPLGIIVQSIQNIQRRIAPDLAMNAEVAQQAGISVEGLQDYFEKRDIPVLIQDILDAGKRAATIVTNMLNFSRHSSSGMLPASIEEVLRKSVELAANDYDLKKKYDFRNIKIVYEIEPALPPVACMESKLEQVILNLLKNAAQAIGEHGSNGPPTITCRALDEPGNVRIEIEDNGPGMTEDVRRRVFEPFFTTKVVGTGTGLGLSVSYFIVKENHNGSMSVESVPDKGTKFVIRLPRERKAHSKARIVA